MLDENQSINARARHFAGIVGFLVTCISFASIPYMKAAKKPADKEKVDTITHPPAQFMAYTRSSCALPLLTFFSLNESPQVGSLRGFLVEIMHMPAMLVFLMVRFTRTVAACGTGVYLFYLQHVSKLEREPLGRYGLLVPVAGMIIQIVMSIFWYAPRK